MHWWLCLWLVFRFDEWLKMQMDAGWSHVRLETVVSSLTVPTFSFLFRDEDAFNLVQLPNEHSQSNLGFHW